MDILMKSTVNRIQVPELNLAPQSWADNILIPITFQRFLRQGVKFLLLSLFIIASILILYFAAYNISKNYEDEIMAVQGNSGNFIKRYLFLQENIKELEYLAEWRNKMSLSEQFAALASFFNEKGAFLTNAVHYSGLNYVSDKLSTEIRNSLEKGSKSKINNLNIIGIWEVDVMIPVSEINTMAMRNNIVMALQNNISDAFRAMDCNATLLSPEDLSKVSKGTDKFNFAAVIWNRKAGGK